jgi:hypothetical protein
MSDSNSRVTLPSLLRAKSPSLARTGAVRSVSSLEIEAMIQSAVDVEVWSYAVESLLCGAFLVLWVYTLVILLDRQRKAIGQNVNYFILACAFILFGTVTAVRVSCSMYG